jgi:uncharacterized protein (DUF2384 family)
MMANTVLELSSEELQNFFGLSQEDFDQLRGQAGQGSETPVSHLATHAVEDLWSIKASLEAQFEPEEVQRWLHSPNPMFDGKAPIDMIAQGEIEPILEVLIRLEEGIHN